MKKRGILTIIVLVLCVLFTLIICSCKNKGDDETTTTYTYSFTIDSTNYTYELTVSSTGSSNLKLKAGTSEVYQFNELSFSKEGDSVYKFADEFSSLNLKLNSDNTFEINSVNGEIFNLILGYEVYSGDYTVSGNNTTEVTLNSDGSCLIADDEATFLPWNGGKVIISNSSSSAVCAVDLENNQLTLEGASLNKIDYIFDAKTYRFDSPLLTVENQATRLYLSQNGNKAIFKNSNEVENSAISYYLYSGSYQNTNGLVNFSYGVNSLNFVVNGFLFDYYYEEFTVGEKSIKLYNQNNKTIYNNENGRISGDSVTSSDDYYIFSTFTQDVVPVEITYVIDADNLNLMATYFGDFQGVEGVTYTASDNSEIVIVNNNTLYHCSGDYTQPKSYSVETYSASNYDPNVINLETGHIPNYYLAGDTFHYYSPPTNEERLQIISNPSQTIYGNDVTIGEYTPYMVALLVASDAQRATILIYNLATGSIGTIQHSSVIIGDLLINENKYQITTDTVIYEITVTEGKISGFSELN